MKSFHIDISILGHWICEWGLNVNNYLIIIGDGSEVGGANEACPPPPPFNSEAGLPYMSFQTIISKCADPTQLQASSDSEAYDYGFNYLF